MDNLHSAYLAHHGVKGMKWGVRRAQKKQAKVNYKAAKKAARSKYDAGYEKNTKGLDNAVSKLDRGTMSRLEFERMNAKATKGTLANDHQYRSDKAKAKRDYKVAIGKNADKANAKYERAKNRSAARAQSDWDYYVESIVKDHPDVANTLAKTGTMKYSDILKANQSIQRGLEAEKRMQEMRISQLERENARLKSQQ